MRTILVAMLAIAATAALAQRPPPPGPMAGAEYVRLGLRDAEALLLRPPEAASGIALVYAHPNGNSFQEGFGPEMAKRGHAVLLVNFHAKDEPDDAYLPGISQAIRYLRARPDVRRVVLVGHSGGGHLAALYQNVAENGPLACAGPEKLYPCRRDFVEKLDRADGVVLLDPTLGSFHGMNALDPAQSDRGRDPALDMFAAANGFDAATGRARYAPEFVRRFYRAQGERNAKLIAGAQARLAAIEAGSGRFKDDEPLLIEGMGYHAAGFRLYQPDLTLQSHTRGRHLLLKADGSTTRAIIRSVRPPMGERSPALVGTLATMSHNTTVRHFLAASAIRTTAGYAITANDIRGVDWRSSFSATPGNAEGITAPTLVLSMSCHYLIVPGEIVWGHLAARDKSFAVVEGATHLFQPCEPRYGNTAKRTFDHIAAWLAAPGRFR